MFKFIIIIIIIICFYFPELSINHLYVSSSWDNCLSPIFGNIPPRNNSCIIIIRNRPLIKCLLWGNKLRLRSVKSHLIWLIIWHWSRRRRMKLPILYGSKVSLLSRTECLIVTISWNFIYGASLKLGRWILYVSLDNSRIISLILISRRTHWMNFILINMTLLRVSKMFYLISNIAWSFLYFIKNCFFIWIFVDSLLLGNNWINKLLIQVPFFFWIELSSWLIWWHDKLLISSLLIIRLWTTIDVWLFNKNCTWRHSFHWLWIWLVHIVKYILWVSLPKRQRISILLWLRPLISWISISRNFAIS